MNANHPINKIFKKLPKEYKGLKTLLPLEKVRYLTPPLTLHYMMKLGKVKIDKKLKIVFVGASKLDFINNGVWFAMLKIAKLIPQDTNLDLTFVGPELEPDKTVPSELGILSHRGYFNEKLCQFLKHNKDKDFNMIVLFQPGFEMQTSLLDDGSLKRLMKKQKACKTFISSYASDEFDRDKLALNTAGFSVKLLGENPYTFSPQPTYEEWVSRGLALGFPIMMAEMEAENLVNAPSFSWGKIIGQIKLDK